MVTTTPISIRKKYSFALLLIAILSILAYFNLLSIIETQTNDGKTINLSGKQRMLSQRIPLLALQKDFQTLQKVINQMEESHKKLLNLPLSDEIYKTYYKAPYNLDKYLEIYLDHAKKYTKTLDQKDLDYILTHAPKILKKLDHIVSIYQKEAEAKIQQLKKNELYILLLTLSILIFELFFIFYPMEKNITSKTKQLIEKEKFANLITQANTNAIIVVDQNFSILTFNKSAERIFGYTKEEMLYTKLLDDRIIPQKYLPSHIEGIKTFMKTGKLKNGETSFELEAKRKDGTIFPIRVSFGIYIDQDQKIVVANIQDITAEKEKDMLLLQQSRLAAMGEMIGNIAHQWRQPLSAISTLASGAKLRHKNGFLTDEELYEILDKIKQHTQYLSNTIDDFRNFFSRHKEETIFDINNVVKKSAVLIEATYESNNIELFEELFATPIMIQGSDSELSQVLLNILNNAKDILIEKKVAQKVVLIKTSIKEKEGVIEIFDNGGGIPEEIKMKIFDPYFTTKHKSQGTGIGLFMSNKIIQQHFSGSINVTNSDFKINNQTYFGAKFIIKIPLVEEKTLPKA